MVAWVILKFITGNIDLLYLLYPMKANAGRPTCNLLKSINEIKNQQKQNEFSNYFCVDADFYGYVVARVRQWESTRCLRVFALSTVCSLIEKPSECARKPAFFLDIVLIFGLFSSPTFYSFNVWWPTWEENQKQHEGNGEKWAGARLKWRGGGMQERQ